MESDLIKDPKVKKMTLFNQELFNESIYMAEQMDELTTDIVTDPLKTTNRIENEVTSFNEFKNVAGARNYCGQAACAAIIKAWGHHGNKSDIELAKEIYSKFPPDIFGGACGTSPARIAEILCAYNFKVEYAQVLVWLPGGFLNPLNQIAWQNHRSHIEDKWVKAGFPVIVLVDAGKVGGPWYTPHWVPFSDVSNQDARICNSLPYYKDANMNIDEFHQAWEVGYLPNLNFIALLPQPL